MKPTSTSQVARATTIIMFVSVFSKLAGFAREQVIASLFGATGLTDAYVTAWTVAQMFVGLIAGAAAAAFLPVLVRYLSNDDHESATHLSGVVFRITFLLLGLAALGLAIAAPTIVRLVVPNFTPAQQHLTATMLRFLSPTVVLMGIGALLASYLNAHKIFGWPAAVPLALSLATIAVLLVLKGKLGIYGLAWATLIGTVVQLLPLIYAARRQGAGWLWTGSLSHPGLRQIGALVWPILVGSLFGQLYLLIDKTLASGLDAGSIAALSYATKLVQLPVGIFVTALATAIFPTLSEHAGKGDMDGLGRSTASGIRLLSLVMVPAAVGLIVLRTPIVALAFQRGSFDQLATAKTATALAFYAVGLLGVANIQVLSRAFYSLQDSKTPVVAGIATSLLNIALAFVLVKPLQHGGLALANSLAMLTSMTVLVVLLQRKIGISLDILFALVKITSASALMGCAVWLTYPLLKSLGTIVALGGSVTIGLIVYMLMIVLLRVEEVHQLRSIVMRRLRKAA